MKIDRKAFIQIFLDNDNSEVKHKVIDDSKKDVNEFSIGNKFFYSLPEGSELKKIQENIAELFLKNIEINNSAIAFRQGLSYFDFLEPHKNGYYFLRIDVTSFFHSIKYDDIKKTFSSYFKDEILLDTKKEKLIDYFIRYVTFLVPEVSKNKSCSGKTILPVGFLTSPSISNIVFRKLDIEIQKFCQPIGIVYTRYADDMLFSCEAGINYLHSESFEKEISILLSILGLNINKKKTIRREHTISLNGHVIQGRSKDILFLGHDLLGVRISNKKTKIIQDIIFAYEIRNKSCLFIMKKFFNFKVKSKFNINPIDQKLINKYAKNQLFNKLSGYRSYLISAIKFNEKNRCFSSASLEKYHVLISSIEKVLNKLDAS